MLNILPATDSPTRPRRPEWLKVRIPSGEGYNEIKQLVQSHGLHTVCEEARCPNIAECWERRTATFMILGDVCTRSCGFCAVKTGRPSVLDWDEPRRVADAVLKMALRHAVITSVNRDELQDGGSLLFAETIRQIQKNAPRCRVEVLIPDFKGNPDSLQNIIDARPDILNHNTETVPRLYKTVRPQGNYQWSLDVLRMAKSCGMVTKTGLMLGLGESETEVLDVMHDLAELQVNILTLGQYLQPTKGHLPVRQFVTPQAFNSYREQGLNMGFQHVESGPLVRSSYHADSHVPGRDHSFRA